MEDGWITAACPEPSEYHRAAAEARQNVLTKPLGSLGVLERLAVQLASLQATERPRASVAPIVLFAGDHGVTEQGVSAYPSDVTTEMLRNFARGGAAIAVLARELGARLHVVDVGTLADGPVEGVVTDKPRHGTRDFSAEPAMTQDELVFAIDAGRRAALRAIGTGAEVLILGEMGIGNTTSAAALAATLLGVDAGDVVGAGTGLSSERVSHKANVVRGALMKHGLAGGTSSVWDALRCVGGFEIAALAGAMIAAAQERVPVLVDGFIASVAALAAIRLNSSCTPWLIYSHRSMERGHRMVLDALGADPILDLKLRLGEGSGAATALPILRLACALHAGMATFEEAELSGPES
jgi:nicotinate-nucleotide--dimethylbenzimidazole phosphoribosyltransferase